MYKIRRGYIPPSYKNDKKQKFTYTKVYPYCWLLQCLSAKLHKHKKSERGGGAIKTQRGLILINLPTQQLTHIVSYYIVYLLNYINIKKSGRGGAIKTQRGLILINLLTQHLTHIISYYIVCLLNYINIKKSEKGGGL